MFGKIHIHRHGSPLCHALGGLYIQFDAAAGTNPDNCCADCLRRFTNLAKMMKMDWNMKEIDKAVLRGKTENVKLF